MNETITKVAGIDTGQTSLDVGTHPVSEKLRVGNACDGHRQLVTWLKAGKIKRVGIEASGGYERAVVAYLRKNGFEVVLLQPRQVRAFAEYKLRRAKNDRIDARVLALFVQKVQPRASEKLPENQAELAALVTRRRQLVEMKTAEENRLHQSPLHQGRRHRIHHRRGNLRRQILHRTRGHVSCPRQ